MHPPVISRSLLLGTAVVLAALAGCDPRKDPAAARQSSGEPGSGAINRQTHAAFFPIETGVHGTADCNSCHGSFATFKEFTCLSCHEHAQQPTDTTHAGLQGYAYDSKACLGCHPSGQVAGSVNRDDHTARFFPIAAGPHGSATCGNCHANPAEFKEFTCLSCHEHAQQPTDATHAGLQGYAYDSRSCLSCHPKGEGASISRMDHSTRFFPIAIGNHGATACSSCHANPANIKELTCVSCHEHSQPVLAPPHGGLAGYAHDTTACLRCHPKGESVLARADHARFFPVANGRHALPCTACHLAPPDYKAFECIDCHEHAKPQTDAEHREESGYQYNSAACYRCHPRGNGD
jgi:hypothetical protein